MIADAAALKANLASIRYNLLIGYSFVTVSAYRSEADYGAEIQSDFEKFRQSAASDHLFKFNEFPQMNHIEAGVLERVTRLFPETFAELENFVARNVNFFDSTISRFDREIQFYVAYLDYMRFMTQRRPAILLPEAVGRKQRRKRLPMLRSGAGPKAD